MKRAVFGCVAFAIALGSVAIGSGCMPEPNAKAADGASVAATELAEGANSEAVADDGSILELEWTPDSDCSVCHAVEAESFSDAESSARLHESLAADCAECHADAAGLSEVHEGLDSGAKPAKRLKATSVEEAVCLSCHDRESLAQATENSTVLEDSNGTVVNPHSLPENDDHGSLTCSSCHKLHSSTALADSAQAACVDCHHSGVYECYTCHE